MKPRLIHLIHLIHVTAVCRLAAQDAPRDTATLAPMVVTATRTAEPQASLANAVTVLDGAELRRAGVTTVVEALRGVPSLVLVRPGGEGSQTSLFLRGGESDYVRVLVDGVPLNQPGGAVDIGHLTTENVERIEIVRGPASVLYGSDAVTGVIQVFTRRGQGPGRVAVDLSGGSHRSSSLTADALWGGARAGLSAGFQRDETDGFQAFNSQYENASGSLGAWLRPDTRTDIRLFIRARSSTLHFPTDGSGQANDSNAVGMSRQALVSLDAGRWLSSRVELRALLTGAVGRDSSENAPDSPGDTLGFYSESRRNTRRLGADVRANVHVAAPLTLVAGAAFDRERTTDRGSSTSVFGPGSTPETTLSRGNTAAYLQAVARVSALSVQAGARVDDNEHFGTHGTWRLGASLLVTTSTRIRVNGGTAFKEPTFDEIFSTAFSTGNPALRPEQSTSLEAGIEQQLGRGSRMSATYFHQRFHDVIEYRYGGGGPDFHNVAAAIAEGVETELHVVPVRGLSITVQHTWLRTDVTAAEPGSGTYLPGQPLLRRPRHSASLSAEWYAGAGQAVGARLSHVGARDDVFFSVDTSARVVLPDYTTVAAWARIPLFLLGGGRAAFAVTARVENLLDKQYFEVAYYRAPGRRIMIGARVDAGRGN